MKNFAMIGAAGYIAPRHMRAIKETNNNLVAALDKNDSVGVIDSYFPDSDFFVEFERFDRKLDLLRRNGTNIDYVSIASPNYLHDSHIRFSLRHNAHAICEKPLVLNPHNIEALAEVEQETGRRIYNILQLRLHPSIVKLKTEIRKELTLNPTKVYDVDLTYMTSRGNWYFTSWKGDETKSGGIATNIGVHFFDMLGWIFGDLIESEVHVSRADVNSGYLVFKHARVRWFLSINAEYLPVELKESGLRTFRSISVDNQEIEFSEGFTDLHTASYKHILSGGGFGLDEARKSIDLVSSIRTSEIVSSDSDQHPFVGKIKD